MKMRITAFQSGDASTSPAGLVDASDPVAVVRAARDRAASVVVEHGRRLTDLLDLVNEAETCLAADQAILDRFDVWLAAQRPGGDGTPSAAFDQKALAVARLLADVAADQSNPGQALARMQCVVLDAMRWAEGRQQ